MSPFACATLALLPPFAFAAIRTLAGSIPARLAALSLASSIGTGILVLMTFAFDQPAFADLPLTLALMTVPGTIAIALFLERWL